MSLCHPSNGAAWDTPVLGTTILVPPGTQVLATPTGYPCGGEAGGGSGHGGCGCGSKPGSAVGVSGGASAPNTSAVSIYPLLRTAVEVPAVNGLFQIYSTNASQWAVPGMRIWFPPFGYAEITGVTGDLITAKNLNLPAGTVLQSGSQMIVTPPPVVATESETTPGLVLLNAPLLLAEIAATPSGQSRNVPGSHTITGKTIAWLMSKLGTAINQADSPSSVCTSQVSVNGVQYAFQQAQATINNYYTDFNVFPVNLITGTLNYTLATNRSASITPDNQTYAQLFLLGSQ